jgi:hypothetical protein
MTMSSSPNLIHGIVIGLSHGLDRFYEGQAEWQRGLKDGLQGYCLPSDSPHLLVCEDYADGNVHGFAIREKLKIMEGLDQCRR